MTATRFIHLYLAPLFHAPTSKESPIRQRRKIGMANDRYSPITAIDVTAKNAIGRISGASLVPTLTSASAGSVTRAATTATPMTAFAGTRDDVRADQSRCPGTARSRLNAKVIRDAEVRQDVAQKN